VQRTDSQILIAGTEIKWVTYIDVLSPECRAKSWYKDSQETLGKYGKIRCVGMRVTDQILILEDTKSRLTSGDACYYYV
jgi:hypothetical protein